MITTLVPPGRSSSAVNARPTWMCAPNSSKNASVTSLALTDSKRSPAASVMSENRKAAMLAKVDGMDRHALNFASDASTYAPSGAVVMNHTMRDESG